MTLAPNPDHRRIRLAYLTALGVLGVLFGIGYVQFGDLVDQQAENADLVNRAGRQRMLVQGIMKDVLLATYGAETQRPDARREIQEARERLRRVHEELRSRPENSSEIRELFHELDPDLYAVVGLTERWPAGDSPERDFALSNLRRHEVQFIRTMDRIVCRYAEEADSNTRSISAVIRWAILIALLVLVAEALMIFEPMVRILRRQITRLQDAFEEVRRAESVKGHFLTMVSHEMRTPLTSVIGFTELARHEENEEQRKKYLASVDRNSERLLDLINQILDFTQLENRSELPRERVDVPSVLETVSLSGYPLFSRKRAVKFVTALGAAGIPQSVRSHRRRLEQILKELVRNASQFTTEGEVRLEATADRERGVLEFAVRDTGIGVPADKVDLIFEPFRQAQESLTRQFEGAGLGLSICQRLAMGLGGTLTVSREPGGGSCFRLTVPLEEPSDEWLLEWSPTEATSRAETAASRPPKVLIVEDNPEIQWFVTRVLEKLNTTVGSAENGQVGVERVLESLAASEPYDLVLMDLQMPVMDGLTAIREIRAAGFDRSIIVLSANSSEEDRQQSEYAGCDAFLAKPVRPSVLVDAVKEWSAQVPS